MWTAMPLIFGHQRPKAQPYELQAVTHPALRTTARVSPGAGQGSNVVSLDAWKSSREVLLDVQAAKATLEGRVPAPRPRWSQHQEPRPKDRLGHALAWCSVAKQTGRNLFDPKDLGPRP